MTIVERPIYGQMTFETAPASTLTFVDRTADIVGTISYSEGGRRNMPGANTVDVGLLTVSLRELATVPDVGSYVRLRRTGTTEYAFVGTIQDVSQRVVFDNSVSLATPVTITTLSCVDFVAIAAAWQVAGVGGRGTTFVLSTGSYNETQRIRALNYSFDATASTELIKVTPASGTFGSTNLDDTDIVASMADHLDLMCRSTGAVWFSAHVIPTNNTTGRDHLIQLNAAADPGVSSGKTFTDVAGTAGQLHYTEIDFESSSQNISNVVTIRNQALVRMTDTDLTIVGGSNESNQIFIDLTTARLGLYPQQNWRVVDATSVTTYGQRFSDIETNLSTPIAKTTVSSVDFFYQNLIPNGSAEYFDIGYGPSSAVRVRRRKSALEANPFTAYHGEFVIAMRQITAAPNAFIRYSGGESDGIPVTAGRRYRVEAQALRGTVSRTDVRAKIEVNFFDASETLISTVSGTNISLTTANQWNQLELIALAPANSSRATIDILYTRSSGANQFIGDLRYADALMMHRTDVSGTPAFPYFDGDSSSSTNDLAMWTGQVGLSPSIIMDNNLRTRADAIAAAFASTSILATRIRYNAQEDLTAVSAMTVGKTIDVVFDNVTTTYRIIGIDGNVSAERYMIDYYLVRT